MNEALLELISIYLLVIVQSWKGTTLKIMNGIKDVYSVIYQVLKNGYFSKRNLFTGSSSGKWSYYIFNLVLMSTYVEVFL